MYASPMSASQNAMDPVASKVYEMRSVGHVLQKKLDIEEASPIVRDKLSTAIAGVF